MKRMLALLLSFIVLSVFCLNFTSCTKAISEGDKKDAINTFLTEFCSFNKDSRYKNLLTGISSSIELDYDVYKEKQTEVYKKYLENFFDMTTEKCLNDMAYNRYPAVFDKIVLDNNLVAEIDDIKCVLISDNIYSFEVMFKSEKVNKLLNAPLKGSVKIKLEGNRVYVDSIVIDR